ncbi:hypothetical protein ACFTZM_39820, partial [Streptomyces hydrogenans]
VREAARGPAAPPTPRSWAPASSSRSLSARALTSSRASLRRHRGVEEVLAGYQSRYVVGRWTVWGNLPPADVWQLRRPARVPTPASLDVTAGVSR